MDPWISIQFLMHPLHPLQAKKFAKIRWHHNVFQRVEGWKSGLIQTEVFQRPFKTHFRLRRQDDALRDVLAPRWEKVNVVEGKDVILRSSKLICPKTHTVQSELRVATSSMSRSLHS